MKKKENAWQRALRAMQEEGMKQAQMYLDRVR